MKKCEVDAKKCMAASLKYCPEKTLSLIEKSRAIQELYKKEKLFNRRTPLDQVTVQNVQHISDSLQKADIRNTSLAITNKSNQAGKNEELTQMVMKTQTVMINVDSAKKDTTTASSGVHTSASTKMGLQTAKTDQESKAHKVRSAIVRLQPNGRFAVYYMMRPRTPLSKTRTLTEIISLPNRTFQLDLYNSIRVNITLDGTIRVSHKHNLFDITLVASGGKVGVLHKNCRALHVGGKAGITHVVTFDTLGKNKNTYFTKITKNEISFKNVKINKSFSLGAYKLQANAGTFEDLSFNITQILFDESILRNSIVDKNQSNEIFEKATHKHAPNGTDIYKINGYLIKQSKGTGLTITNNLSSIQINPSNKGIDLSSGCFHCKVSSMDFFIRQDNKRILHSQYNESKFVVRNKEVSAGFKDGVFFMTQKGNNGLSD